MRLWKEVIAVSLAAIFVLDPQLLAQSPRDLSGLWLLDLTAESSDIYGEIRLIHQTDEQIGVTMIDYGTAWIEGEYRGVVRILPWTFRFGNWAPRRGPADSKQPKTRARWSGEQLVLAKSTFSGNGEFVWLWSIRDVRLEHRETHKTWDADFRTQPTGEDATSFVRTNADDPALLAFGQRFRSWTNLVANPPRITVHAKPDLTAIFVDCPEQDCRIIDLDNGVQAGSRSLIKGQVVALPPGAEVIIHPVSK